MIITLNGKPYKIKQVSELSFTEFNKIFIQGGVSDLTGYLSLFCDIDIETLLNAKLSGASIPALDRQIFNLDFKAVLKDEKKTVEYDSKIISMEELAMKTFGNSYMFELIRQKKGLNQYEVCMYALAIAIAKSNDMNLIQETYRNLSSKPWSKVLPQGFFLAKHFSATKINSVKLSIRCIWELKAIRWKWLISRKKYQRAEKI